MRISSYMPEWNNDMEDYSQKTVKSRKFYQFYGKGCKDPERNRYLTFTDLRHREATKRRWVPFWFSCEIDTARSTFPSIESSNRAVHASLIRLTNLRMLHSRTVQDGFDVDPESRLMSLSSSLEKTLSCSCSCTCLKCGRIIWSFRLLQLQSSKALENAWRHASDD